MVSDDNYVTGVILPQSAGVQSANKPAKQARAPSGEPLGDFIWPMKEKDFVITLQEDRWTLGSTA